MEGLRYRFVTLCLLTCLALSGCATRSNDPAIAAVATAHPLATQAALRTLDEGGNAFDAAIAAAAVLGVVEPHGSGLGGGSFWLLRKTNGEVNFVDAREVAPQAATADFYLGSGGQPQPRASLDGPLAAAIPGQPAALAHLARHYAERPLSANLADAIRFATLGFRVDSAYLNMVAWRQEALQADPVSRRVFLDEGDIPGSDFVVRQPELARTLQALARDGHDGFYMGPVAKALVADVQAAGGRWTEADLAAYRISERRPLVIRHADATIFTAPPPSAGGIALTQMFAQLEVAPVPAQDRIARIHHLTEVMRRAYRDRHLLGDPDAVNIPYAQLLDRPRLHADARAIDPLHASPPPTLPAGDSGRGFHTTHLSIIDGDGNAVAATLTLNLPFGAAFTSPATGVLLNNEMDDFAIAPGVPNAYGLPGARANAIAPGKRPLSSMTPTLLLREDELVALGTPGGSRIISMVFLALLDVLDRAPLAQIAAGDRFHHQYWPHQIQFEQGALSAEDRFELESLGHQVLELERRYGNLQIVRKNLRSGDAEAASDPRGVGLSVVRSTR